MVFFTIIIVTKYFLGLEECPLFKDSVANGTMLIEDFQANSTNLDSLRDDYLSPAGASRLMTAFPVGTYVVGNSTTNTAGHIVDSCPNKYQLPEGYCNLDNQVCDANMFTFNEKVRISLLSISLISKIFRLSTLCQQWPSVLSATRLSFQFSPSWRGKEIWFWD